MSGSCTSATPGAWIVWIRRLATYPTDGPSFRCLTQRTSDSAFRSSLLASQTWVRIRSLGFATSPLGPRGRFRTRSRKSDIGSETGDVLIGMDGDFHLRQWRGGDAWLNQRVARLRPKNGMSALHLMLGIAQQIVEWNGAIVGTTVAHLGKRHLEQVRVLIPAESLLTQATEFFDDASRQACALDQGCRRLRAMRDLLLPRLVTGQIDVSSLDLDALVEDSVA